MTDAKDSRSDVGDFEEWIAEATDGLSLRERTEVRVELEWHYADAIRDQLRGLGADELLDPSTYDWFKGCIGSLRPEVRAFLDVQIDGYYGRAVKGIARRGALSLEGWLKVATKELAEEGKLRVEGEITAHYDEALAAALREGKCPGEAHGKALVGLGSAVKAGRAFGRVYLTLREEKRLERLASPLSEKGRKKNLIVALFGLAMWSFLLAAMSRYTRAQSVDLLVSIFAMISVVVFVELWLIPYLCSIEARGRALYWNLTRPVVVVMGSIIFLWPIIFGPIFGWPFPFFPVFLVPFLAIGMGFQVYECWRIARKVGVSRSVR